MRLEYQLAAVGEADLKRALRSVEAEVEANARRGASRDRARVASTRSTARQEEAARIRSEQKAASAAEKAAEKERRTKEREAKRGADAQIREERRVSRERERQLKWRQGIQNRHYQALERDTRRSELAQARSRALTASKYRQGMGRVATGTLGVLGRGLTSVGTMAGIGVGALVASSAHKQTNIHAQAAALANQAFDPNGGRSREEIKDSVLAQAKTIGNSTGLGAGRILDALGQFQAISGRLDIGQSLAPLLAEYADATGADMGDVGKTGGQIVQSLAAKGTLSDAEILSETQEILAAMAGQAKKGSIEFADLAQQMGKVMSATAGFDGKTSDLANTMGAVAQLSLAGGASSPEEAMTSIMRLRDDIIQNSGKYKKLDSSGQLSVFTDKSHTKIREPMEIIAEMLQVTKGDLTKVKKMFGIRAAKAVSPFQEAFVQAGGVEDPKKGVAMIMSVLDNVRGAKMSDEERQTSAAFTRQQTGRRFDMEWEKLTDTVGEKLLPKLDELVPKIGELTPKIVDLTEAAIKAGEWLAENPFSGLGLIVNAFILKELATAAIGQTINSILVSRVAGAGGPLPQLTPGGGPIPAAPGKKGGVPLLGASLPGLAAMLAVWSGGRVADIFAADNKSKATGEYLRDATGGAGDDATVGKVAGFVGNMGLPFISDMARMVQAGRATAGILDPGGSSDSAKQQQAAAEKAAASADKTAAAADKLAAAADKLASVPAQNRTSGMSERP